MFFIQVVRGRPGGRLQFSGEGSKMAWLASALYAYNGCEKNDNQNKSCEVSTGALLLWDAAKK